MEARATCGGRGDFLTEVLTRKDSSCALALGVDISVWGFDLILSPIPAVPTIMRECNGKYLTAFKNEARRDCLFEDIDTEDSPRSVMFPLELLRAVGFADVDVLHKNVCFAALGGVTS